MKIGVVGTGYVGLVTGTCLAETGHHVICVDQIAEKVDALRAGRIPIYEPGIEGLLTRNAKEGRLSFTTKMAEAVQGAPLIFLTVGTPSLDDGTPNMTFIEGAFDEIVRTLDHDACVVVKSTVPVGTCDRLEARVNDTSHRVEVISNPEFLKEGAAVDDFMKPDRVVIGVVSKEAELLMKELYAPFVRTGHPILVMDRRSSEMTKYVSNSMLAARISFMNEMANLADKMGADIDLVRQGVGTDTRIGTSFLFPGLGYGGSCFPKDIQAVIHMGQTHDYETPIASAVHEVNQRQKGILVEKVIQHFGEDLKGKTFALWGLAFKPRTDDVREAPSLVIAQKLLALGATLKVYDPEALHTARAELGDVIEYCEDEYEAAAQAHGLLIVTEWNQFRRPDFNHLKKIMAEPVIFDGRNIFTPKRIRDAGFAYCSIGRP